ARLVGEGEEGSRTGRVVPVLGTGRSHGVKRCWKGVHDRAHEGATSIPAHPHGEVLALYRAGRNVVLIQRLMTTARSMSTTRGGLRGARIRSLVASRARSPLPCRQAIVGMHSEPIRLRPGLLAGIIAAVPYERPRKA